MDPVQDKDLFWIAKEGLKAPLPEPWKPCKTAKQEIYYFNFQTGESIWEHPCDQHYKQIYQEEKAKKLRGSTGQKESKKTVVSKPPLKITTVPSGKTPEKLKNEFEVTLQNLLIKICYRN